MKKALNKKEIIDYLKLGFPGILANS